MSVASLPPTPTVSPALPLHRNLRVAIVTCATIALLIVLTRYWPIVQGALHEISLHPTVLLAGPLLALCFIACKGASLTAACHAAHMPMTPRAGVRTFIEGTVIESISWPGKLMGDIYRASVLPATSIIQRASALVLWRIGTLLATLILVITAAALTHNQLHTQSAWHHAALLAAVITAACIATWFIASRTHHLRAANLTGRRAFTAISRITAYSLLATLADLTAIAFFAATIANVNALTFLPLFICASLIASASTILWNGPMGVFEIPACAEGTFTIAKAVAANRSAVSIIGGGDSVTAIKQAGVGTQVTFISTGGGASLEFLEGKVLPGVAALQDQP